MFSPIQTKRHWIRRLYFEPQHTAVANSKYHSNFALSVTRPEDRSWSVILKVSFGGNPVESATFKGLVEFEGIFEVKEDFPEDKKESLVRMNGGAILYGAVRELVLNLTARSKHGPFELPTIDARMFLEERKESLDKATT